MKIDPKIIENSWKIELWSRLGALWAPSWRQDCQRVAPRVKINETCLILGLPVGSKIKPKSNKKFKKSFDSISVLLSRYFAGLILQIFILFIIYTILLLIIGTPNAIVIAFLCSLLNLIPFIGPFIGGILMILLTMSSHITQDFSTVILAKAIYVAIGFAIGQLIDNFLSQPFIFSNSVKSHPLEIFIVIISGGLLFGAVGMIAAVPTYTALKVIGKEFLSENRIIKELTKNL